MKLDFCHMHARTAFLALAIFFGSFVPAFVVFADAVPLAQTQAPDFVTEKSARLNGWVNPNQTKDTQYWFEWGFAGSSYTYTTDRRGIGAPGFVRPSIVGLHPDTTYFVRLMAENSRGNYTGQTTYFTTKSLFGTTPEDVRVSTLGVQSITERSVTVQAFVAPHMNTHTTWWFEYGEGSLLDQRTQPSGIGGSSQIVTRTLSHLRPGIHHSYRIVGESVYGRRYGAVMTLTTDGSPLSQSSVVAYTPPSLDPSKHSDAIFSWDLPEVWQGKLTVSLSENGGAYKEAASATVQPKGTYQFRVGNLTKGSQYFLIAKIDFQGRIYQSKVGSFTIPAPSTTTTGISKIGVTTGTSKGTGAATQFPGDMNTAPPAIQMSGLNALNPFARLFGSRPAAPSTTSGGGSSQVAAAGASGGFLSSLFGKQNAPSEVALYSATEGERKAHSTIQYTIRYANSTQATISSAVLKVIYPKNVIYIGDDTSNEFMVEENSGSGERTYVLNIGDIPPKAGRTITMLGMLTNDTRDPSVRAHLYYRTGGEDKVLASRPVSREDIARSEQGLAISGEGIAAAGAVGAGAGASGGWHLFPTTFLGWVLFALLAALLVVGYHKLKAYYLMKKKQIEDEKRVLNAGSA